MQSHILYTDARHCKLTHAHAWTPHVNRLLTVLHTVSDFSGQRSLNVNCSHMNATTDRL